MQPLLEVREVSKRYPGVLALDRVNLTIYPGEIHALAGENGAGKSTLIKCITGAIAPSEGEIVFEGVSHEKMTPAKSIELGIAAIYQELNTITQMTVAENIFFGRFPTKYGFVDYKTMNEKASQVTSGLGLHIDPEALAGRLTVGYQQLIEIAKSVSKKVKLLILDEPSAPLTNRELDCLFKIIAQLKAEGVAMLYISHRLDEIFQICDRVTVFRDGKYVDTKDVKDCTKMDLIRMMVNRELAGTFPKTAKISEHVALKVEGLETNKVHDISFEVRRGEILGFAGLVGAGRTETARAVFGADKIIAGNILIDGVPVKLPSPRAAIKHGIALIPEDRKSQGALLNMAIKNNIIYANLNGVANQIGLVSAEKELKVAKTYQEKLSIKTASLNYLVNTLSGGNQQKVVLAKWLYANCDIIFFDEPTRGIDVGTKQDIYELMDGLAKTGKAIIMISSEMLELIGMSDRIIVMHEGRITGELQRDEVTQEKIMLLASGMKEALVNE